jgi:hypothetical protein
MSAAFGSINRNGLPKRNKGAQYGHVQVHHMSKSVISENTKISSLLFPIRDRAFFLRATLPKIGRAAQAGARWALQIMRKRLWMKPQSAPANPMLAKKPARTSLASALRDGLLLANRARDADWLRAIVAGGVGWANIVPKRNLNHRIFYYHRYYCGSVTRCDKLGTSFLPMTKLACMRHYVSMA